MIVRLFTYIPPKCVNRLRQHLSRDLQAQMRCEAVSQFLGFNCAKKKRSFVLFFKITGLQNK